MKYSKSNRVEAGLEQDASGRVLRCCMVVFGVVFVVLIFTNMTHGQQSSQPSSDNLKTDAELLEQLASPNGQSADNAAGLIRARGERMIGPLMKLRGDKRFYKGVLYQNPNSSEMMFSATGNAEQDKKLLKRGDLITVEVAALYLISAIYYERFDFAHAPFLVDRKKRWEDQRKGNTPKLIDRAWEANEKWYRKFTESGIQKLRAGDEYPLKNSQVEFW